MTEIQKIAAVTKRKSSSASMSVANEAVPADAHSNVGGEAANGEAVVHEGDSLLGTSTSERWKAPRGFLWIEAG